jgi:hypothetical protein
MLRVEWTSPQKSSGRFTTIGSEVLRTTTHWKGTSPEGLPRTTLLYKMARFGICRPVTSEAELRLEAAV